MKIKEDMNYAAGVATGMEKGSNKIIKPKKKYKFKSDTATLSGMSRSYFEEKKMPKNPTVTDIMSILLEAIEEDKRPVKRLVKEEQDTKLLEDYKLIKFIAQKGINEVSNGHNNKKLMSDILEVANRYEGETSLGEGAAETEFTNTSMDSYHEVEGPEAAGKNNPTE